MPRKPATHRLDGNHHQIADIAKRYGWQVVHTHSLGGGFPDFLAYHPGHGIRLIEVKVWKRLHLTEAQKAFRARYSMPITTISSEAEAEVVFSPQACRSQG